MLGYVAWRDRVDSRAEALLAEAVIVTEARVGAPPAPGTPAAGLSFPTERERSEAALTKFKVAADAYPVTDAGSSRATAKRRSSSRSATQGRPRPRISR